MLRFSILPLILLSASVLAAPLKLGVVLGMNESISDFDTTQRYRAFANEVGRALGQPVELLYYKHDFAAIKHAKDGTLDMIFGPAQ